MSAAKISRARSIVESRSAPCLAADGGGVAVASESADEDDVAVGEVGADGAGRGGGNDVVCLALTAARGPSTIPARAASRVVGVRNINVHPEEKYDFLGTADLGASGGGLDVR